MSDNNFEVREDRLLRLEEVMRRTTLSKTTVYELIKQRRFPRGVAIAARRRGWRESEISRFVDRGWSAA